MKNENMILLLLGGIALYALSKNKPVTLDQAKTAVEEYTTTPLQTGSNINAESQVLNYVQEQKDLGNNNAQIVNELTDRSNSHTSKSTAVTASVLGTVAVVKVPAGSTSGYTPGGSFYTNSPTSGIKIKGVDY